MPQAQVWAASQTCIERLCKQDVVAKDSEKKYGWDLTIHSHGKDESKQN